MDLKTAAAIILATAGINSPESAAFTLIPEAEAGELPLAPQQKEVQLSRPTQRQQVSPELEKAATLLVVKYGVTPWREYNQSERASAIKLAADLRQALTIINTPEGRAYAAEAGLRPEKIEQVEASLQEFEKALKNDSLQRR